MISNDSPTAAKRKLFFALWPDPGARAALAGLLPLVQGRHIPPAKLHLTLAFLGQQEEARLPMLLSILKRLSVPPMRLQIDCFGYFARPRIAWAGMAQPPQALLGMQEQLMAELAAAGFDPATHGAFKPHITLAREAKQAPGDAGFAPVRWDVPQVALVESVVATGEYVPVAFKP
ncbi:RNA 2',3'-cyclic phosphodiesterase [Pseudoduganella ginsengisoli]|uniref:RNA 2',3'-cyclic phosphodiesterase n=1 Tax=Pseudoduganella ginsengisoli TaxID=1462440 RepID=A0A6L6PUK0_9BURK|nr:RNA 2',3'-cyclic phosphodiesterase [Pseudoduganella ginsengisoli]MTW01125.1 RNA 2',3'-cyclic phosphodiesterase [Pseudoduganella ginsengisoli]